MKNVRTFLRCLALTAAIASGSVLIGAPMVDAQTSDVEAQGVVNINTASVAELTRLPGVGQAKAEAIVAQRERRNFRRVEELMRVRGIGRATFRRLRPMLTIEGETTLAGPAPRAAAQR